MAAGNDIIMPGNPDDDKNIRQAYKAVSYTHLVLVSPALRVILQERAPQEFSL